MRLNEVKISNILSFAKKEDFNASEPDIVFGEAMNIVVGANGSGKSNFVEVIFTLFRSYFLEPYVYNLEYDKDPAHHPFLIEKRQEQPSNLRLEKNNDSKTEDSFVQIKIDLNDTDKKNLIFIKTNFDAIQELIQKYSRDPRKVINFPIDEVPLEDLKTASFKFKIQNSDQNQRVVFQLESDNSNEQKIVDVYLRQFNLFKKIIDLGIEREGKDWEELGISFEFLGAHRNFPAFPPTLDFNVGQDNNISSFQFSQGNQNIKNGIDLSYIFNIPLAKVGNKIANDNYVGTSVKDAIEKQFTDENSLFSKLNETLKEYLKLSVRYPSIPPRHLKTLNLEIFNTEKVTKVGFDQLSSGQKSIFFLIFLVMGLEIKNGLLVIDEPEIHLHPRLQKKYLNLLKKFSTDYGLQSILVTHSPVFVDESTIKNTYRFYIDENSHTQVIRGNNITTSEEELIKFLSYTNSSKIFFTNQVILVEGDTDSYFYLYFLNKDKNLDRDFELLPIQGKHEWNKWFNFLTKLKIKSCFIADFDHLSKFDDLGIDEVKESIILEALEEPTLKRVKDILLKSKSSITKEFSEAIKAIKDKNLVDITQEEINTIKDLWYSLYKRQIPFAKVAEIIRRDPANTKLDDKIIELRGKDIYVLKYGDLETYLDLPNKGLKEVIEYCGQDKLDTMKPEHKDDLGAIFKLIFSE